MDIIFICKMSTWRSAIDLNGQPLPQRTLAACLASDAVLLEQLVDQGGIVRKKDQRKDY